jgi:hypothetical protein
VNDASRREIDALITEFYAAFDNRGPRPPATDALRWMFMDGGRVVRVAPDRVDSWSVDEFVDPREAMLTDGTLTDFHEWETESETTILDNIANRRSHYRKAGVLHGAPYSGEGRKLIQLCRAGGRWSIACLLWEDL